MPRRSSSPSIHEKKIITMPIRVEGNKNLPAIIAPQRPSFLQSVKEGVGLGIGYSIAGAFMGTSGPSAHREPIVPPVREHVPALMTREYEQCMKEYDDKAVCEKYNK
uniref:Uncharacterized protein n=1 Tax=viral metagenome TaxID=1070528 RepID=A0A6C0DLD2_9ZZZZ